MDSRFKRITSATALLLALAISQAYLPGSLAAPATSASVTSQQASAVLTTTGNKAISVNGANAISGATILTGAAIETPDQVGASLNLPGHFSLDISAKASLSVEFDRNNIKVNLIKGCVVLRTKKGTTGEIDTSQGVAGKTDGSKDARLDVCDPSIATAPAAAAAESTGRTAKTIAIIAGAGSLLLIPVATRGANPSPGAP
jgi:hypothetical protein